MAGTITKDKKDNLTPLTTTRISSDIGYRLTKLSPPEAGLGGNKADGILERGVYVEDMLNNAKLKLEGEGIKGGARAGKREK